MANNYRHPVTIDKLEHRSVIKNKLAADDTMWSNNTERATSRMGVGMSPEARKAMVLTRAETKGQSLSAGHKASKADSNLTKTNDVSSSRTPETRPQRGMNSARANPQRSLQAASRSLSRSREATGTVGSSPFTRAAKPQPTARSRSTLSNTGHPCSTASEHNGSCSGADSRNKNRSSSKNNNGSSSSTAGKYPRASSLANNNNNNSNNNNSRYGSSKTDKDMICYGSRRDLLDIGSDNDVLDYDDSGEMTDDEENNNNKNLDGTESAKCKSFVLALDRALEENGVSRLRGDITDSVGITEPGTVRALDGGRLTNAQEVVVNVCHDDERELVFHDDDDDSLDTAKNVSQIRINIWMEYNQGFDVDNVTDDLDLGIPPICEDDVASSSRHELAYRDSSENPSSFRNRDGKANKTINRNLRVPNRTDVKKLSPKRDSNNNSGAETWRPKTSSAGSTRGASSALTGSGVSNEGSKKSSSSSNRRESYLKRKVKA